ncbi:MAG: FtsQ-type POTRA domain-containing protein [Clostridia bacterium]|nr:FtsQ-type POTRA domain-containing protein [Clostridia bacterium]
MEKPMDDFQQKRAMRQKRIRRRRFIFFLWFLLIVLLVTGAVLCATVFFPVKTVHAKGSQRYTEQELIKASGLTEKENLFIFSREKVRQQLHRKLPYVDVVTIKIELPDTVRISVTDAKDYLCFQTKDGFYSISKSGYVLNRFDEAMENVPAVLGVPGKFNIGEQVVFHDAKKNEILTEMIKSAASTGMTVDYYDITDLIQLKAKVHHRFVVNFGTATDLDGKMKHLSSMIKNIAPERTGTINLSMWNPSKKEGSFVEGNIE